MLTTLDPSAHLALVALEVGFFLGLGWSIAAWLVGRILR